MIDIRLAEIKKRLKEGDWEIDVVDGKGRRSVVTIVERAAGYALIGKLDSWAVADLNSRTSKLIQLDIRNHDIFSIIGLPARMTYYDVMV